MKKYLSGILAGFMWLGSNAATFTVTTTNDAGAGSLRQAILDANALAGTDNIVFAVGTGPQTIILLSSVNVTTPMNIDGSTQPGFSGTPLISIGGSSMFNINSVNTGTLSSLAFAPNASSTSINVNSSSNWLFVNNTATGSNIAFQIQGNNTTHTITANNFIGNAYGIYMNGGINNGHVVNNNNLSNCTNTSLIYNYGTPASISTNTFTGSSNALNLRGATNFTLSAPGSGGPNENVFGTGSISGRQISLDGCNGANISGFNFSSQALAPLTSRSPFLILNCNNGTFTNNIGTGLNIAMEIQSNNTTSTITANNFSSSVYGIYMNGGTNNGHVINNNNLSNCTQWGLQYNSGTPASVSNNTFTACNNAIYLRGAANFTLSAPGSGGANENILGTGGITGRQINIEACNAVNVSGFNFSSHAAAPLNTRSPFLVNNCSNGTYSNNIATGVNIAMEIQSNNTTSTITANNFSSSVYGIYMNGGTNNGHVINNNNLSNCTQWALQYNSGTPASINTNTFTGSANALYLRGATNFTLSSPGSGGPNENILGTGGITGKQINIHDCNGVNVSGFNFSSHAAAPLNTRSPFLINNCSNGTYTNNVATGVNIAMEFQGNNSTSTITANSFGSSVYGIFMNGGINNGHVINNNNLSNCTQWALQYNSGTPASINTNTFTGSANALYLRGATNFTLSAPGSGGANENILGTGGITGKQINIHDCNGVNVSGFNFSSHAAAPLNTRSPFLVNNCSNGTYSNNIATGVNIAMEIQSNNTTSTITANNFSSSVYGIYMNGGTNNGHVINNNNLSNCTQWALQYNSGTPASINTNTFTGSANALYLRGATNFTLSSPGSGGPNENILGTGGITGKQINLEACNGVNVSGFNFSSHAAAPLNTRSPFLINNCSNGTYTNNIATGVNIAMEIQSNNTNHTITANNFSGSAYGVYMNGGTNNGHVVNNNNLSNCTQSSLTYNTGTPASISSNTFTGSSNALYLRGANTFTLGSTNVFKNQTGTSIQLEFCTAVNVSNNSVNGTGGHGILVNQSGNCVINGNTACGRTFGIRLQGTSNANSILNGSVVSCGTGIMLDNSSVNNTTITAVNLFNTTNINNSGLNTVITGTTSTNTSPVVSVNSGAICSGSSFTMTPTGALTYSYTGGSAVVSPTTATSYSVVGMDLNGCVSAIPAVSNVTVNICAVAAALNFDGTDDFVDGGIGVTNALKGKDKLTVEAWVYPTQNTAGKSILGNHQNNTQFNIQQTTANQFNFFIGFGAYAVTTVSNSVVLNTWQHIAGVFDDNVLKFYINGVLSGTTAVSTSYVLNPSCITNFWIGKSAFGGENFQGGIDEVRIWDIARTQCEINTYKNCEIPTTATGLLANYHLNQGVDGGTNTSVTSLTDASASAFTGTLTNMALTGATSNWVAPGGVTSGSVTPANLAITVGATVTNPVICTGNSTTLNGTGADTYVWTGGLTNAVAFTPTVTNTYTVTGTNTLTGCTNTAVSTVTVNSLPVVSVSSGTICAGQSYTIIASGASTYSSVPSLAGPVVNPTTTTNYSITGTDANGCVSSNTAVSTVIVNTLPTITVNSGAICAGQSFTMFPTGAVTYTYSNGSNVVTPSADATYSVSGTDANGCVSSIDAVSSVTVNTLPIISVNSGSICSGQSFTMVPSGASTYTYSNGSDVITPTATDSYTVTGTAANGCVSSSGAISTVTVNVLPVISVSSGSICAGQSFTMVPTGASTYTYSGGSDVVTPSADATYSVSGTDANGCVSAVDAVSSVTVNALPTVLASTNSTLICTGETATLSVNGASTYTWSTMDNTPSIAVSPTVQTTYTVEGTDANGCVGSTIITQDVSLCTGLVALSNNIANINVYPNPNNGLFVIELTTTSKVTVTNALGQVVIAGSFEAGKHNVDIHNETTGVYFVKVIDNNRQQTIKIVKQ